MRINSKRRLIKTRWYHEQYNALLVLDGERAFFMQGCIEGSIFYADLGNPKS